MAGAIKTVVRLINLGGPGSAETANKIREIIHDQWGDQIIEGSGEGSADYDIAIVFGQYFSFPVIGAKGGTRIEGEDLEDLIEKGLKFAFDDKIKSRIVAKGKS